MSGDLKIVAMAVTSPKGLASLADLFMQYKAAVADVGEEKAGAAVVEAAQTDLAARVLRTFFQLAETDHSLLKRIQREATQDILDDERQLADFFGVLAREFVRGRSGDPQGDRYVEDMSTARTMYKEIYDRVIADRGQEAAEQVTLVHARTMVFMGAAIFGVGDIEAVARDVDALIRSLLADD